MKFTATFVAVGERREIVWEDGKVSGDYLGAELLKVMARVYEGTRMGPPCGPLTTSDHLASPYSAASLLVECPEFEEVRFTSGVGIPPLGEECIVEVAKEGDL